MSKLEQTCGALVADWAAMLYCLQDWAAAEELHSGSSGGPGAGHHVLYWELTEAAWTRLQGAGCTPLAIIDIALLLWERRPERLSNAAGKYPANSGCLPSHLKFAEADPADVAAQLAAWAAAVQRALSASSQFYAALRTKRLLGPAELRLVGPGAFAALRQAAVQRGAAPEQCKPPVVVKREWERQVLEGSRWYG